jgi:hypothetical protein
VKVTPPSRLALPLILMLMMPVSAIAQERSLRYSGSGSVEANVYPLFDEAGTPIQWEAPVFSGFLRVGPHKTNACKGSNQCYYFDGLGNWTFIMSGNHFCKSACTYYATGDLQVSDKTMLADGSFIYRLAAPLVGTFTDENGIVYSNVVGFYSTFTVPTSGDWGHDLPVPATGGISIVLQDN